MGIERAIVGRHVVCLTACLMLAGLSVGQRGVRQPAGQTDAMRSAKRSDGTKSEKRKRAAARKELAAAGKLARVPRGTPTVDRARRLEQALRGFEAIERRYTSTPSVAAMAAFREGEVLRRLRRVDDAVAAFERAARVDSEGIAARALVEAGHALRRAKQPSDALVRYRASVAKRGGRYSDTARLWVAKTLASLGRIPDAQRGLRELGGDTHADARTRIRAFDDLAMSYVKSKDLDQAKGVIRLAEESLAAETSADTRKSKGLRRSLEHMRARKSIAKLEAKLRSSDRK